MKLPKNYFNNLSTTKYKEYLKLLPNMQQENTRIIITLIFTFFAMSFFGIFAINPTLSTIVSLKKQLADAQLVHDDLKTKIANLSVLQQQYTKLGPDLPVIYDALPKDAKAPTLLGQILGLAKEKRVKVLSLETTEIELFNNLGKQTPETQALIPSAQAGVPAAQPDTTTQAKTEKNKANSTYTFSIKAEGTYDDLMNFTKTLTKISRIISIESLSITKNPESNLLVLSLGGRTYFQK